jgi:hypothetical protein
MAPKKRDHGERALWGRVMGAADKCLDMDRRMLERIEFTKDGGLPPKDVDGYLDPALWEHYVQARRDLVDFTTSSIKVLTRDRPKAAAEAGSDIETRLMRSLSEMAALEEKFAAYLTENLEVLGTAITELTRNQTIFTKYAKTAAKPEPGYLSSQA